MDSFVDSLSAEEYAGHAAFVRRIARRLSADESCADDLVQDAWVAALEHPPAPSSHIRAWFSRVVRNQAALHLRSGKRRKRREHETYHGDVSPDTASIVENLERHRQVVEAVLALPEPYRCVLVRRFGEDEKPAVIARKLDLSEATVRTRLRRGLDRLRDQLRKEFGGTPALFLAELGRLTGDAVPNGAGTGSIAGSLSLWTLLITMKKTLVAAAVVLAAILALRASSRRDAPLDARPANAQSSAAAPATELPIPAKRIQEGKPDGNREPAPERAERKPEGTSPGTSHVQAESAPPISEPRDWVTLHIEDTYGNPIPLATVKGLYLRLKESPSSARSFPGEAPRAVSDAGGRARLQFPPFVTTQNAGHQTTSTLGLEISHPEYSTRTLHMFDVSVEEQRVVLDRGAFVIVSGWIDTPTDKLVQIEPLLTYSVNLAPGDWIPLADGRPSCSRIPPGRHAIFLRYEGDAGDMWFSEPHWFDLVAEEQKELNLQLLPAASLAGALAANVPRPVKSGEAILNLYLGGHGATAVMLRTYSTQIGANGTFRFEGLPPGAGEIIALCEGWASKRVPGDPDGEGGTADDHDAPVSGTQRATWGLQQVDPSQYGADEFLLAMEPTSRLEVTVLDPTGAPLQDAWVSAWPNVTWSIGYSTIFLERTWRSRTNGEGIAVLENLPPEDAVFFGVTCDEGYLMPLVTNAWGQSNRNASIAVPPGEWLESQIQMEEQL